MNNSKNEWAEIYQNQKVNLDDLTVENANLTQKIQGMEIDLDLANKRAAAPNFGGAKDSSGGEEVQQEFAETQKRLKKRELECQALWDTLKDMRKSGQDEFDVGQMWQLLERRALNTKAARKLDIQM
jgi:hypothetical protein